MASESNSRKPAAAKPTSPLSSDRLKRAADAKGDGDLTVYAEAGEDGTADLAHSDELDRMVARLIGINAAVENAVEGIGDDWGGGVLQLIIDAIEKMEKCAADFDAVRKVREAKADKNAQQPA